MSIAGKIDYYGTEDPSQGGDAQRYTLSFSLENPVEDGVAKQQVFLTLRTLRIVEDFTGFLLDNPEAGQSFHPQRGDAIEQDYDAITAGARGSYRRIGHAFGQPQSIELGYYARYDHTDPEIQRLRFGSDIPYLIDTTLTTDVLDLAAFADLDLHPLSWLTLRGGARQEFFSYDILDNCATDGEYLPKEPMNVLCPAYDSAGPRQPTARITATGIDHRTEGDRDRAAPRRRVAHRERRRRGAIARRAVHQPGRERAVLDAARLRRRRDLPRQLDARRRRGPLEGPRHHRARQSATTPTSITI